MDDLLKSIESSFPLEPIPDQVSRVKTSVASEHLHVEEFFLGKCWTDISMDALILEYPGPQDACLGFMNREASLYYLPTFLKICITDYERADTIVESTISSISCADDRFGSHADLDKYAGYTTEQRKSLARFLRHIKSLHEEDFPGYPFGANIAFWRRPPHE